jgi:hypothetical protein
MIKVEVEDIFVTSAKPKPRQWVLMYGIITRNEYDMRETVWVDVEQFNKEEVEKLIKKRHAMRLGIPETEIEVEWLVEPPRIRVER